MTRVLVESSEIFLMDEELEQHATPNTYFMKKIPVEKLKKRYHAIIKKDLKQKCIFHPKKIVIGGF